jgi:uncharacterized protein YhaN
MVQAVGSTPFIGSLLQNGSTGGLQAQLAQAQSKLADCLHCATANTPEGKAQIQAWTIRVHSLESRIHDVEAAQRKQASAQLTATSPETVNQVSETREPTPTPLALGGSLDVLG